MQPHLGDIPDMDTPPMVLPSRRKQSANGWIERGLPKLFGFIAVGLFFALVIIAAVLAFYVITTPPDMTGR